MSMKSNVLNNKKCLITGAAGEIGKQLAIQLLENNCDLFLTSKNESDLTPLTKSLSKLSKNNSIFYQGADLNNSEDIKKLISTIRKNLKTIDILINSAGIYQVKLLSDSTLQDFDNCFNVNVRAPFILTKEFSKDMINQKWGRIVNIGSSSSYDGFEKNTIYCSSKHALLGFSRSVFKELKRFNVRTFCISPRGVRTKMHKNMETDIFNKLIDPTELSKFIVDLLINDNEMICNEVRVDNLHM
jgi:3-oxoacyl-[acyl-carrier protein] reductase